VIEKSDLHTNLAAVAQVSKVDPPCQLGKADVIGEETGTSTLSATPVGVQASEERSAEITLGSVRINSGEGEEM